LSQIQKRFQCSRAEASVARALALGFSPQEVADQRGSSIYTTRAQIRVLLQLSASHRIAELVAKILHLGNERERVGQSD
jgi:DNA-binding CsgD family transcriptional regulator